METFLNVIMQCVGGGLKAANAQWLLKPTNVTIYRMNLGGIWIKPEWTILNKWEKELW